MSSYQAMTPSTASNSIQSPSVDPDRASARYAANLARFNQTSRPTSFNPSCPSASSRLKPAQTRTGLFTNVSMVHHYGDDKQQVEKPSCICGLTRKPLRGYKQSEANGIELTAGEHRQGTGWASFSRYDITNCTGRAKEKFIEAEWLRQRQKRAAARDGSMSEVPRPELSEADVKLCHYAILAHIETERRDKEEADKPLLAQQETILQDTFEMRSEFNRGEGGDDGGETFFSDTGVMDSAFDSSEKNR